MLPLPLAYRKTSSSMLHQNQEKKKSKTQFMKIWFYTKFPLGGEVHDSNFPREFLREWG